MYVRISASTCHLKLQISSLKQVWNLHLFLNRSGLITECHECIFKKTYTGLSLQCYGSSPCNSNTWKKTEVACCKGSCLKHKGLSSTTLTGWLWQLLCPHWASPWHKISSSSVLWLLNRRHTGTVSSVSPACIIKWKCFCIQLWIMVPKLHLSNHKQTFTRRYNSACWASNLSWLRHIYGYTNVDGWLQTCCTKHSFTTMNLAISQSSQVVRVCIWALPVMLTEKKKKKQCGLKIAPPSNTYCWFALDTH